MTDPAADRHIQSIEQPDKALWTYYILVCLIVPPVFPILILPAWFRYHTMRYKFSADGISMSWGILFRREIIVNYARIQDIHLNSNIVERWLGRTNQRDAGVFAAEVGFGESKNYVFKVMSFYRAYRQLYDANLNRRLEQRAKG